MHAAEIVVRGIEGNRHDVTTSSALNYFYAVHADGDNITVSDVLSDISGTIRLTVSNARGNVGDTMLVACDNIGGAIQANVTDAAAVVDSTHIDLLHTSSTGLGTYTGGGNCRVTRLVAELTGHSTGPQGIQLKSDDDHYTLVGMCNIGASHSVSDTSSERDCASWYNRGVKTCINKFTADRATILTGYSEVNPEIRCGFVTWGTGDPTGASDLSWSISGMMKNGTSGDGAAATAGFDTTSMQETEESAYTNPSLATAGAPASVRGSKTGLLEGAHFITLLGKAITGGPATYFGSVPHTTLEIRIPQ